MALLDDAMQKHRAPGKPASSYWLVPFRWWDDDLYVGEGKRLRRAAVRSSELMIVFFAAGVLAFIFNL